MKQKIAAFLLAIVMLVGLLPFGAVTVYAAAAEKTSEEAAADLGKGFSGKTISILGDSISTYANVSNNTSYNTTIGSNKVYYKVGNSYGVSLADTWWQQTIDTLDLELLVNNSWSGSAIYQEYAGTVGAYINRCVNLHNDNEANPRDPDIIAVFLGTNDFHLSDGSVSALGATPDYSTLITEGADGTYTYQTPTTIAEAYAIMLQKITVRYPDAELYCLSLLPLENMNTSTEANRMTYNAMFQSIAEHYDATYVNQYQDSGITGHSINFDHYMANALHPNAAGMDAMTNCFISALLENSQYSTVKDSLHDVSYTLDNLAVVTAGTVKTAVNGEPFAISFVNQPDYVLGVSVKMGGSDITRSCYANGVVSIPAVTGDISITATARVKPEDPIENEPKNYYWQYDQTNGPVSMTDSTFSENTITKTHGTIQDGVLKDVRFILGEAIVLNHNQAWSIEWKSSGEWTGNGTGAMLFAEDSSGSDAGNRYFYRRKNADFFALGEYSGSKYYNYGVDVAKDVADHKAEHVWKMANRIAADGSNMVYLYVDGKEIGPMDQHYVGGTKQKGTSDWLTGKNFTFGYLGTDPFDLTNCNINYIKVWESTSKVALKNKVAEAETLVQANYTGDSWAVLQAALTAANTALNNADTIQSEADAAEKALEDAMAALVQRADKTELQQAVNAAEALIRADYTGDSWAVLEAALAEASAVMADDDAVQATVDSAADTLLAAIRALEEREDVFVPVVPPVNDSGDEKDNTQPFIRFADVSESDWFYSYVYACAGRGLFNGDSANTFSPHANMTRAMVWTVLGRIAGQNLDGTGAGWYTEAQHWAVAAGVSDGSAPNGAITREELVTMLWRFVGQPEGDVTVLQWYNDDDTASVWAKEAMAWAVENGIIEGANRKLNPQAPALRAQVAAIAERFCVKYVK